ncbi:pyridoxal phosphate-dependent aminotransferase [Cognatishimia sp. F0-27]|uniref:pyridoxal phosphate-dependent aminotransferase n=1 Tax=Cognatishimia sp. F0-27 TaxID=2816855 RepID=UPI001D0C00CE|nr:pyridoxal phosphate-dependent aminotransferase [Cognatishimia sp. F0-27]MCC1494659.1 pyridoxal phosphate-dependent aminotransferase [Cognatishimia sp. F0-27]
MSNPRFPDHIKALPDTVPFVGPEVQERALGSPFSARIGANESVFGPSPFAIAAMQDALSEIWKYGDPSNHDLRAALAERFNCVPGNIIVGEGIDGLLGYTVRLLVEPGDAVVTSLGAYPTFNYHVTGFGGALHTVPYRSDKEDIDALIEKAHEVDAKLIYFANPDNPMGTWYSGIHIEAALDRLPEGTLLLLDEAYIEFAPEGTEPKIDPDDPRVIRFRTFSKAYGMAGARVGYGIGAPNLIKAYDKIRNHFGMNRVSQIGALAALQDTAWLEAVVREVIEARDEIERIARDAGLRTLPSATNFVTVDCGRDGDYARAVLAALIEEGIFVRMPGVAPQDRCIRVTAGKAEDLAAFERVFSKALAKASAAPER